MDSMKKLMLNLIFLLNMKCHFKKNIYFCRCFSGCSAARLARYVRDVEVVSSNLTTPTKKGGLVPPFLFSIANCYSLFFTSFSNSSNLFSSSFILSFCFSIISCCSCTAFTRGTTINPYAMP